MAEVAVRSPQIIELTWGRMRVQGLPEGKDFMLYPGGGREWDWTVSGTDHERGIQPADVQVLLDHGATVVVLSRGMQLRLRVAAATVDLLDRLGIAVHVAQTAEAMEIYNGLVAAGRPVGGLFHSTC